MRFPDGKTNIAFTGVAENAFRDTNAENEVSGKPLNDDAQYTIAVLDYNANGGDDCTMLINLPRQNNGLIFRSQLEEYFAQLQKEGKSITASIEGRITSS